MRGAMPLPAQALEEEGFTLLCVPGGFAQHYRNALGEEGRARIEARRAQALASALATMAHRGTRSPSPVLDSPQKPPECTEL